MESPDLALAIPTMAHRASRRPRTNSRLSPQVEEARMLIEPKIHSLIISHIKIISKIYYKTVKDSFNNIIPRAALITISTLQAPARIRPMEPCPNSIIT